MYIIKTKNESYTGEISGIAFSNGVARVEGLSTTDIEWFKSYGHTVEEETISEIKEETRVESKVEETGKNKKGK